MQQLVKVALRRNFCKTISFFTAEFSHFFITNFWGGNFFIDKKVTKFCSQKKHFFSEIFCMGQL
jgi:hypothetical protein